MTRTLLDLVYVYATTYVERVERVGQRFRLVIKAHSRISPATLAKTLRYATLGSVEVSGQDLLVTTTDGDEPVLDDLFFELGPFEEESYSPDKLVLRRRGGDGVQRIEVLRVATQEEEWRRFLAREVDVSLFMSPGTLTYLSDVPSVRIVPVAETPDVALHFRTDSPIFADREMRRHVAGNIRRAAVAQMATGDRTLAIPVTVEPALANPKGATLTILSVNSLAGHQQAVLVLEQRLVEMGFTVKLKPGSPEELVEKVSGGEWDAMVFYAGSGKFDLAYASRYLGDRPGNIPRYKNPEYDAAVAAGDLHKAKQLLADDVPFTPLYRASEAVAIDRRFCGVHPRVNYDLSWLADVHLCAPGEAQ